MLTIHNLQESIEDLDAELAALKTHALAALRDDPSAQKALSTIDAKVQTLLNDRQTLIDGIAGLEAELDTERALPASPRPRKSMQR